VQGKNISIAGKFGPIATYVSTLIENLDNLYQYTEPI